MGKEMSKFRHPSTIEYALDRAAGLAGGYGPLADAVGKKEHQLRKFANSDDEDYHIQLRTAFDIDKHCKSIIGETPILDWYQRQLASSEFRGPAACINETLLEAFTIMGRLGHEIREAKSPTSVNGKRISACERQKVDRKLDALEARVKQLRRALDSETGLTVVPNDGAA